MEGFKLWLESAMQNSADPCSNVEAINQESPAAIKIALFRSMFRGRTDVYPVRFESRKTGKAGYSPACANEWVRGVCEKPRIKCTDCSFRRFLPVTDEVIADCPTSRKHFGFSPPPATSRTMDRAFVSLSGSTPKNNWPPGRRKEETNRGGGRRANSKFSPQR
jgi:hypothetical protein